MLISNNSSQAWLFRPRPSPGLDPPDPGSTPSEWCHVALCCRQELPFLLSCMTARLTKWRIYILRQCQAKHKIATQSSNHLPRTRFVQQPFSRAISSSSPMHPWSSSNSEKSSSVSGAHGSRTWLLLLETRNLSPAHGTYAGAGCPGMVANPFPQPELQ